jgi:hypothetical protein
MIAIQGHLSLARQERRIAASFALGVLALAVSFPSDVEAASCRSYSREVRAAIKKHVGALRALEQETADRLKGFDTRTFEYLLGRARATAASIADKDALAAETRSAVARRRFLRCGACVRRLRKHLSA